MPRAGLSTDVVVERAAALADADGLANLSLAALAEQLGVRVPSLYKHIGGLADLQRRLAVLGLRELRDLLADAGAAVAQAGGGDPGDRLRAFGLAYRRFAVEHPGRYATALRAPDPDDAQLSAIGADVTALLLDAVAPFGLYGESAVHAARALRSAMHGFVTLEAAGGFAIPVALDTSYARMLDLLVHGLGSQA